MWLVECRDEVRLSAEMNAGIAGQKKYQKTKSA